MNLRPTLIDSIGAWLARRPSVPIADHEWQELVPEARQTKLLPALAAAAEYYGVELSLPEEQLQELEFESRRHQIECRHVAKILKQSADLIPASLPVLLQQLGGESLSTQRQAAYLFLSDQDSIELNVPGGRAVQLSQYFRIADGQPIHWRAAVEGNRVSPEAWLVFQCAQCATERFASLRNLAIVALIVARSKRLDLALARRIARQAQVERIFHLGYESARELFDTTGFWTKARSDHGIRTLVAAVVSAHRSSVAPFASSLQLLRLRWLLCEDFADALRRIPPWLIEKWRQRQHSAQQTAVPMFSRTPREVADRMMELAEVTAEDVVYDLGCGDGRIVRAAARAGARAIGIDNNPILIEQARKESGDNTEFRVDDFLRADFSDATVLALYIFDEFNLKILQRLIRERYPSLRIVSRDFRFGPHKPRASEAIQLPHGAVTRLYRWNYPEDFSHAKAERNLWLALRQLSARQILHIVEASICLFVGWLCVKFLPFRRIASLLGDPIDQTETTGVKHRPDNQLAAATASAIHIAARNVPWDCRCLCQAIAASLMLRRRGLESWTYFGGKTGDPESRYQFHAWLRHNCRIITGAEEARKHTVLAVYHRG